MDDQSSREGLRKRVFARHRDWILANRWQSLGDLAKVFPEDPDIEALARLTGRIYKLYYLIEDVEGRAQP
ncbi:MAG TPA: hypothetical protein VHB77_10675 [Planctomycetaceae bacterium]|nr:hypothetical protein [Planctomycetaceae bacterium]